MTEEQFLNAVEQWQQSPCTDLVLDILHFASPLSHAEFVARLSGDPTLDTLEISPSKCDRIVRSLLNSKIRVPAGKPKLPQGAVDPSMKVSALITDNCS